MADAAFVDGRHSIVKVNDVFEVRYDKNVMSSGYKTLKEAKAFLKTNRIPDPPKPAETKAE
jgi:hypothetical protein